MLECPAMFDRRQAIRFLVLAVALLPALHCVKPSEDLPYLCSGADVPGECPDKMVCAPTKVAGEMRCVRPDAGGVGLDAGPADAGARLDGSVPPADASQEPDAGPGAEDVGSPPDAGPTDGGKGVDAGPCGNRDEPCCTSGEACHGNNLCDGASQHCRACGDDGEQCCEGGQCNAGFLCAAGLCTCGGSSQPCCPEGTACSDPKAVCLNGKCQGCGAEGEACCPGAVCGGATLACGPDGLCKTCGQVGGPCCKPAGSADPLSCSAGACIDGTCQDCGASGKAACLPGPEHFCIKADEEVDKDGNCVTCGAPGGPCCRGGRCNSTNDCCDAPAPGNWARTCIAASQSCPYLGGNCATGFCYTCDVNDIDKCCPVTVGDGGVQIGMCNTFQSTGPRGCNLGNTCEAPCGTAGKVCCVGDICLGFARCNKAQRVCEECGTPVLSPDAGYENLACPGLPCSNGCHDYNRCIAPGQPCASGGVCSEGGACTACGGSGQACCAVADAGSFCLGIALRCASGTCQ